MLSKDIAFSHGLIHNTVNLRLIMQKSPLSILNACGLEDVKVVINVNDDLDVHHDAAFNPPCNAQGLCFSPTRYNDVRTPAF